MCNVVLQRVFAFQLNILLLLLVMHRVQCDNALLRLLLASKPLDGLVVVIIDVLIVDILEVLLVGDLILRAAFHQASLLDLLLLACCFMPVRHLVQELFERL